MGVVVVSLYSTVDRNVKGKGAALTEAGKNHMLTAPQHLCLLFNEVAYNLQAEQRHHTGKQSPLAREKKSWEEKPEPSHQGPDTVPASAITARWWGANAGALGGEGRAAADLQPII